MLVTDQSDAQLTDAQWEIADAIARQLVLDGTDVNEVQKAIAYLRGIVNKEIAGKQFFDYLKMLVRHGNTIGHSKRTVDYYRSLDAICTQYLTAYQDDAHKMLFLLGWAARLVKYYRDGVPISELTVPVIKSERESKLIAIANDSQFLLGQEINAVVAAKKGNKVTYEIMDEIRLTQKEPKIYGSLSVGQAVIVEVIQLKDMNTIKRIKIKDKS
jgi:hypothetical protein